MVVGAIVLLLVVTFSDQSTPMQAAYEMPTVETCARALTMRLSVIPPEVIEGHPVLSWSAACVTRAKTAGS